MLTSCWFTTNLSHKVLHDSMNVGTYEYYIQYIHMNVKYVYKPQENKMAALKTLTYKGSKYTFIESVSVDLIYPVCRELLNEPQQTECGHIFCKDCLSRSLMISAKDDRKTLGNCVVCKTQLTIEAKPDQCIGKKVLDLGVKCTNDKCTWAGLLCEHPAHKKAQCGYERVQCPLNCGATLYRFDVAKHKKIKCLLRKGVCNHCNKKGTFKEIAREHYFQCPSYPVSCPNDCGVAQLTLATVESHLKLCPKQMIACPFFGFGCNATMLRCHLAGHTVQVKDKHLDLAMKRVGELTEAHINMYATFTRQLQDLRVRCGHDMSEMQLQPLLKPAEPILSSANEESETPILISNRSWCRIESYFHLLRSF